MQVDTRHLYNVHANGTTASNHTGSSYPLASPSLCSQIYGAHSPMIAENVIPFDSDHNPNSGLGSPNSASSATTAMTSNASSSTTTATSRRKRGRPNWAEFYRNGFPKDVIVIDSDDDDNTTRVEPASHHNPLLTPNNNNINNTPSVHNNNGINPNFETSAPGVPTNKRQRHDYILNGEIPSHKLGLAFTSNAQPQVAPPQPPPARRKRAPAISNAAVSMGAHRPVSVRKARNVQVEAVADDQTHPTRSHNNNSTTTIPGASIIDDDDGHLNIVPNTMIANRYQVVSLLGQGTFGKVISAYDRQTNKHCAIKIIRAIQKYRDASKIELRVLATLSMHDRANSNRCIHLRRCFDYKNHICIVTDLLDISVFDFLKTNNFIPFSHGQIQDFARQLLTSVAFLHDINLIHTDLKPENILLVDSSSDSIPYSNPRRPNVTTRRVLRNSAINLIDFGSATFQDEYHSNVVSTRHYRAPEIILGVGWSFPCDIWSIGCILVELYTGEAFFQTHDNLEHLAIMETVFGKSFDKHLIRASNKQGNKFFTRSGKVDFPNSTVPKSSIKFVQSLRKLNDIICPTTRFGHEFLNLLHRIFVYDPAMRITAREALAHPWFNERPVESGL